MWGVGSSSMGIHGVNPPSLPSSYRIFTQDCHILLVDNNSESLRATSALLESCYYQVTAVESGLHAMSMLTKRKQHFDLMMTDAHLVDVDVFILLQEAFNLDIPTIFLSNDEDPVVARTSIESGVCFFLEKPINWTSVKGLWQFVMREKSVKSQRSGDYGKYEDSDENYSDDGNQLVDNRGRKMKHVAKKKRVGMEGSWDGERRDKNRHSNKKKTCTAWTEELHAKFIAAVDELGEGRCYPKEILQLMNVKGLTRMQVASHLQKCRNDNWRAPETRKSQTNNIVHQSTVVINEPQPNNKITLRKFGSMPRLAKTSNHHPSRGSQSNTSQGYLPSQNHSTLGILLSNDHHHNHHNHNHNHNQGGSYRNIHHDHDNHDHDHDHHDHDHHDHHQFPNSNNQMENNYMNGAAAGGGGGGGGGGSMMMNDHTPRSMEANGPDVGNFNGGQLMNGHRDHRENRGLDENTSMFMDIANHHPSHHVEQNFENSMISPAAHDQQPSHQNALVDDFFDFLPETGEPSQGSYPKVFNYGSSPCTGGTYTFEPYPYNQNQGN